MLDAQTHTQSAIALARQRETWLRLPRLEASALCNLEDRLRVHLYTLSCWPGSDDTEPDEEHAAFVWLAVRLQSEETKLRQQAAESALRWLVEADPPRAGAARKALSLFPSNTTDELTLAQYRENRELRADLITIWHRQGRPLPQALLNQGELQHGDAVLQASVLAYMADSEATGLDVFKYYYRPLLSAPGELPHPEDVLLAAIRGGLIRGDAEALTALRRAMAIEEGEALRPWLYLAALSGSEEFHPVLQQHANASPETGYRLLALWGGREAMRDLVAGLKDPRTSEAASSAWLWITGQTLPQVPRLSVVGEEPAEASDVAAPGMIADLEAARGWWEAHQDQWAPGERWIAGAPMSTPRLASLAGEVAGTASGDILNLLSLFCGRPLAVWADGWFAQRLQQLREFESTTAPDPARDQAAAAGRRA